ncbi:MAG: hypothetical protein ABI809_08090 [Caldimonas sp.]
MKALIRMFALALAALALLAAPVAAQARPYGGGGGGGGYYHGHHGWGHGGLFWGGVGLGIGLGVGSYYYDYGPRWYPGYVVAVPPVYTVGPAPEPQARSAPDPVIYPNRGQSPAQTEADRQDCNRWATTQPRAMAEASVFHRATLACMEGRGYTLK